MCFENIVSNSHIVVGSAFVWVQKYSPHNKVKVSLCSEMCFVSFSFKTRCLSFTLHSDGCVEFDTGRLISQSSLKVESSSVLTLNVS